MTQTAELQILKVDAPVRHQQQVVETIFDKLLNPRFLQSTAYHGPQLTARYGLSMSSAPQVGVGVLIFNSKGLVLIGKRYEPSAQQPWPPCDIRATSSPQTSSLVDAFLRTKAKTNDTLHDMHRKGSHGAGEYALPGGHLEFGESFEQCAERETQEETGLQLQSVNFAWATNSVFSASKHHVTIFMQAGLADPEVILSLSLWSLLLRLSMHNSLS